jgi:hypothetical protein
VCFVLRCPDLWLRCCVSFVHCSKQTLYLFDAVKKLKECSCALFIIIIITPRSWVLLQKPTAIQLIENFPTFWSNQKVHYCGYKIPSGPYPEPDQSSLYNFLPSSLTYILIASNPRLGLPSGIFVLWLSYSNPKCIIFPPDACYMSSPSHAPWLSHSNYIWRFSWGWFWYRRSVGQFFLVSGLPLGPMTWFKIFFNLTSSRFFI